ncbi:MAG TPA: hypothetical protein ENH55_15275 [Aurantimonas coralicida]|uniref:Uncharacterized protein n=2 Tax=root TaxID=1 RepID=A0A9C9NJQ6_9HYPH|nr:hypothetical protein [Aurantimonas coralicida]HEU02623.1 hypothetical protein [Aurantimonas coralicida]
MAKEKFLIIASPMMRGCFGRFDEDANCAAIDAGTVDTGDAYSWIEASFEIKLIRHREATHICSFTPSAYGVWLKNEFVGVPNEAWEYDGDPDGLELESGGTRGDYGAYRDEYDPRFICETFVIDTVADLGIRKSKSEAYHEAIWQAAEESADESVANGAGGCAPILDVFTYRQWQRERHLKAREESARRSRHESIFA